jgi:MYXO-CTERM domain-containing protein
MPGEATATTSSAIYGGVLDNDASQNASVVAIEVGAVGDEEFYLCTGTLIAPNVVLTARHCISTGLTTTIECDQNGNSLNGTDFGGDVPVSEINVFAAPSLYQGQTPSATAKAVFHPPGSTECNTDIALLVLETSITTSPPLRVRVSGPVTAGESVRVVGYGANDQNQPIGTRYRKDDLQVLAVGSTVSASQTALGNDEFELGGESTCSGDSGGPAIDETTGAVVGLLSRGPADCTSQNGHVYTSLEGFTALFQQAFATAGGTWLAENGGPVGDGGTASSGGGSSGGSSSSGSGSGGGKGGGSTSSSGGGADDTGGVDLQSGKGAGCSTSGEGAPPPLATFVLVGLALLCARRSSTRKTP